jgi:hypothetical protein
MEVNLPSIFSENSTMRTAGFSIVIQILQNAPPGVNVSRMMSVLGRSYDEKEEEIELTSTLPGKQSKSCIWLQNAMCIPGSSPRLRLSKFYRASSQNMGYCMSGFDESVESMFRRFSNAISFAKVNRRDHQVLKCIWNSYR